MKRAMLALVFLSGCATGGHRSDVEQVTLELKGKPGETFDTRYFSNAHIRGYQNGQLVRDRMEAVDFTVTTHVSAYDTAKKTIRFETKTTSKDGTAELHDLAFPELGEELDYVMRSDGTVLKAGQFKPESLFFVPSMPIPKGPVKIGDTWTMDHQWYSAKDSIPLRLEVLAILKDIVSCEGGKVCADVEISGHVNLVAEPTARGARFLSRLWGRMLFSIERGDVIWSEMRSDERMGLAGEIMDVSSCMLSETKLSKDYKTVMKCEPGEKPVTKVPQL